jgi:hypothetical protein
MALLSVRTGLPKTAEPAPMTVALIDQSPPAAPAPQPKPAPSAPAKPPPPRSLARPTPAPRERQPLPADETPRAESGAGVSEAALAGAATAGSGGAGGACNMVRRLQDALRKDRLVQSAAAEAHKGAAILVWNGDWVRNAEQDGKGLAAVREAILWEVGFAPAACRAEPVRGLVLLSLNDAPGSPRLVVGTGEWRWSDMLKIR